jgi:hypothetical protein
MKLSLYKISEKLLETNDKYEEKYIQFKKLEMEYVREFDRLLMEAQSIFGNQPSREAYARNEIAKLPFFEKFTALSVETHLLSKRMQNLGQISRNLISGNFMGEGGDR